MLRFAGKNDDGDGIDAKDDDDADEDARDDDFEGENTDPIVDESFTTADFGYKRHYQGTTLRLYM
mgnify:CR=1 FL=1